MENELNLDSLALTGGDGVSLLPTLAGFALCIAMAFVLLLTARWIRSPRRARILIVLALVAGLLLGAMPTMRYAEVVAGLGVGVFLVWRVWKAPGLRWHVAWAHCWALPAARSRDGCWPTGPFPKTMGIRF